MGESRSRDAGGRQAAQKPATGHERCGFAVAGLALPDVNRHILRSRCRFDCWNNCCDKAFKLRRKWRAPNRADLMKIVAALERCEGTTMISKWSEWKRYPRAGKGENIEAPISPGIYEVRFAGTGALHSFGAVDNVAQALSLLAGRVQIMVRPPRTGQAAGTGISHLRHLQQSGRQGRRRAHDRPPRNLYERRGLSPRTRHCRALATRQSASPRSIRRLREAA